ncbi:threonine/serine exporter family protein [Niallia sp. 03133]|uniref:threonine/serine exporter family protein n=1 Tax=Niallia sp. 03133 TaxID=3458060 RepID=UPI004044567D
MITFLEQGCISFIATYAFAMIFHTPRKLLLPCGFVGMCGWLAYWFAVYADIDMVPATIIGAFLVAVISHFFAKKYKTPVIIFSVSGIIPLVPGGMAYDAMRHFVENNYSHAVSLAAKAFLISGSIAMGLMFSEVLNQLIYKVNNKRKASDK